LSGCDTNRFDKVKSNKANFKGVTYSLKQG